MTVRVNFVAQDDRTHVSGVSTWLRSLVPRLREAGVDARVDLLCQEPGVNAEWFSRKGVPLRWARAVGDTQTGVRQCLRWLREDPPSVYVPNTVLPAYFAAAEAKRCGMRTVGILHSDDPFYWGLVDEFVRGKERWRLSDLVAVSAFLGSAVAAQSPHGVSIHQIPYGISIPVTAASRTSERIRMVYTGRLIEEQKRISEIARAFCRAVRQHPRLEAWIVGSGRDEPSARKIIEAEGMQGRVILKGRVDPEGMQALLQQCHIHVLLSDYEGLPVALLEAMAAGVVPVCLDVRSGIGEVVRHLENGLIVQDRERSFLDAVTLLLNDEEVWMRMSVAARSTVAGCFSEDRCVAQWKDLLHAPHAHRAPIEIPALDLELPPRNPVFEHRDRRYPPMTRSWYFVRRQLGYAKRQTMKLLGLH